MIKTHSGISKKSEMNFGQEGVKKELLPDIEELGICFMTIAPSSHVWTKPKFLRLPHCDSPLANCVEGSYKLESLRLSHLVAAYIDDFFLFQRWE